MDPSLYAMITKMNAGARIHTLETAPNSFPEVLQVLSSVLRALTSENQLDLHMFHMQQVLGRAACRHTSTKHLVQKLFTRN